MNANKYFTFSTIDQSVGESDSPASPISAQITLTDCNGLTAQAIPKETAYPSWPVQLYSLDSLFHQYEYKSSFKTFMVAQREFNVIQTGFDWNHIKSIQISFPKMDNGNILIDDIGITEV